MKTYSIRMPIAGIVTGGIEAKNEQQAIELFIEKLERVLNFDTKGLIQNEIETAEISPYREMVSGFTHNFPLNKVEVDLIDDADELNS